MFATIRNWKENSKRFSFGGTTRVHDCKKAKDGIIITYTNEDEKMLELHLNSCDIQAIINTQE